MPRRPRPDLRPNWRDPDMPVFRDYLMPDGTTKIIIDQDYERRYREMLMETTNQTPWNLDPTYDLKKQRKRP